MALNEIKNALQLYATDNNGGFPATTTELITGKYITSVNPSVVYNPVNSDGTTCASAPCFSYTATVTLGNNKQTVSRPNASCTGTVYCSTISDGNTCESTSGCQTQKIGECGGNVNINQLVDGNCSLAGGTWDYDTNICTGNVSCSYGNQDSCDYISGCGFYVHFDRCYSTDTSVSDCSLDPSLNNEASCKQVQGCSWE